MNEKELGRALLHLDGTTVPGAETQQMTQKILQRDRRLIRWLAALVTFFWILATGGVASLVYIYLLYLDPRLRAYGAGRRQIESDVDAWVVIFEVTAWSVLGCILSVFLAAVATVLLILFSRRATLRQINASLVDISEQLKRLHAETVKK